MSHDNWRTPHELFKVLDKEFLFGLDACASAENSLCGDCFISAEQDALTTPWGGQDPNHFGAVFCNPPYSLIGPFVQRAFEQSQEHHITTIVLIPSYTDPKYWSDFVMKAHEVRFLKGRLAFLDENGLKKTTARFPSTVVINKWMKGEFYGKAPLQFCWDWRK